MTRPEFGAAASESMRKRGTGDKEDAGCNNAWALLAKQMCDPSLSWFASADTDGSGQSAWPGLDRGLAAAPLPLHSCTAVRSREAASRT